MPSILENLTPDTPDNMIQEAISAGIEQCMAEPIPAGTSVTAANKSKWCSGKTYGIARQKTGKELNYGR